MMSESSRIPHELSVAEKALLRKKGPTGEIISQKPSLIG